MHRNADVPWDSFDSQSYAIHNYGRPRDDDMAFLRLTRDYLESLRLPVDLLGLDVGSGPNLYPSLLLLPWCREITLLEYASTNVEWLKTQIPGYDPYWDSFWKKLLPSPGYARCDDPRARLAGIARVVQASLFELPARQWDIGTMFFVAESITGDADETRMALNCFCDALRPGSPLAMAFMEHSEGYSVGTGSFPAVSLGLADVSSMMESRVSNLSLHRQERGPSGLRPGYTGMILALGQLRR